MKSPLLLLATALAFISPLSVHAGDWRQRLETALPLLGHRNWIVIADAAYPWQTSPGIETLETGADQLEVTRFVLEALEKTKHVRPIVHLDRELGFVSEVAAPGITAYRDELNRLLGTAAPVKQDHEKIIAQLDAAGGTFHVLLLKTTLTLPYTSVFIQLDCGYWDAAREKALRRAMDTPRP